MTRLVTDRLILRAAQEVDFAPLFAVFGNAQAMKYWSTPPDRSLDKTRERVIDLLAPGPRLYFVIEYQGLAVGTAGIHQDNEIGFILHPKHWRKGLIREATQAIIAHVWAHTDLSQITADADPLNIASVSALKNFGFQVTGQAENTFCIDGLWSDSIYFALPRPQ